MRQPIHAPSGTASLTARSVSRAKGFASAHPRSLRHCEGYRRKPCNKRPFRPVSRAVLKNEPTPTQK